MMRVEMTRDRGRIVVATADMHPGVGGLEPIAEEALIVVPPYGSSLDSSPKMPHELQSKIDPKSWACFWAYKRQSKEVQAKIRGFYAEMDCPPANKLRQSVTLIAHQQMFDVEEFVLVAMIFMFNAVSVFPAAADGEGRGTDFGSGLFETACRMSHSCKPNCTWISSQDGTKKLVRLILPVSKGEELTIAYIDSILLPTSDRRETLKASKNFACYCHRCCGPHDETRRFSCESRHCKGVHFVCQTEEEVEPLLSECTECQKEPTAAYAEALLEKENDFKREIDRIEYIADHGIQIDVTQRIKKLRPPHPYHYLAHSCFKIQGELYTQLQMYRLAAKANEAMVACYDKILGSDYNDRYAAFDCERLGDSLQHFNLDKSEQAYQRAVRILQITDGVCQPYSKCAINKLLAVQRRMNARGTKAVDPEHCALCGAPSRLRCSRCGTVAYCQKQHQVAHWKTIHKKQCAPKAGAPTPS